MQNQPARLYKAGRRTHACTGRTYLTCPFSQPLPSTAAMSRQFQTGGTTGSESPFLRVPLSSFCRRLVVFCVALFVVVHCLQVPAPVAAASSIDVERRRPTVAANVVDDDGDDDDDDDNDVMAGACHSNRVILH